MTAHFTTLQPAKSAAADGAAATAYRPASAPANSSGFYRNGPKRVLESLLVLLSAPIVVPFIALLALVVSLDGARPFYVQKRVGKNGRVFRMWKLRSMVPGAEAKLRDYLATSPAARAEWNATQKLKNDPRVTRIGRFLRRASIDELPQLWNVLNGSMSLVGPRPMMLEQQAFYHGTSYYNLRPGITGLWQVSDRNEGEFVGRVKYDDLYDRDLSFKTDASIIARTFGVVLRCTGY